jgi:short chain dehydrogenase
VLINNASVYSHVGAPWLSAYVSSKFAVRGFSEVLRQELDDLPEVTSAPCRRRRLTRRSSPARPTTPVGRSWRHYPTYPPAQVARAIVASALGPSGNGSSVERAGELALLEATAPRLFERVNRRYVAALQFTAEPAPTDGNLYAPSSDSRAQTRAAGGAGRTRQSRSAGWSRPGC